MEDSREKIMQLVDSLESTSGESDLLDETALKRMILLFEKRALKNQEMRIKFPDSPEKYCSETFVKAHKLTKISVLGSWSLRSSCIPP